jgi:hypothetical protein
MLDAMTPAFGAPAKRPIRMAFMQTPNGIFNLNNEWTPKTEGADFEMTRTLKPMEAHRENMVVISGLDQQQAAGLDGEVGGDHPRACTAWLTGTHAKMTSGADIRAGISVDQVAAQRLGRVTKLPSLELGCDRGMNSGNCDSGYSCAYSANIAWKSEAMPMAKEVNPRVVFERLFSSGPQAQVDANQARRERYRKSIVDFVLEDARRLKSTLGAADRRKMDEYFNAVRDLEQRIERAEHEGLEEAPPGAAKPEGIPKAYEEHIRLIIDLLVLAFQGDVTRVATFMIANEGSNRSYPFIGIGDGHHDLSHHGGNREKQEKIAAINKFHISQLAYFLEKLKSVPEGGGTLLDNCMIVYRSGLGDGNRHEHGRLPVLLAGRGGGTIRPGRHLRFKKETPLNNLFLSMLDRMDASTETLGDSTGRLPFLAGNRLSF